MLSLFSKRQINIGFLLIILSLLVFQFFTSRYNPDIKVWEQCAPLARIILTTLGLSLIQNPLFDFITSTLLILFQLILVYNVVNKVKNLEKHSVLVTWIYCWLIHLFPAISKFSPALLALTLILFILYRIYGSVEEKQNHFVFVSSTLIGISFLLWYPSILLIIYLFIVLFQYNILDFKRIIIMLLSFCVPIIWYVSYYILSDQHLIVLYQFSNFHLTLISLRYFTWHQYLSLFTLLILSILGIFQAINQGNKTAKMSRLFIQTLFTLVLLLILSFFLSTNDFSYSLLFIAFPIALFFSLFINIFKRPLLAELVHFTLLLSVLVNFVSLYLG